MGSLLSRLVSTTGLRAASSGHAHYPPGSQWWPSHAHAHTHTHKDTHKIKLFSSNNDMSDSFKSGKTENSDCESIAEVLKYAAYSAGRCFYLNTRDFVRPMVSGLAKVN